LARREMGNPPSAALCVMCKKAVARNGAPAINLPKRSEPPPACRGSPSTSGDRGARGTFFRFSRSPSRCVLTFGPWLWHQGCCASRERLFGVPEYGGQPTNRSNRRRRVFYGCMLIRAVAIWGSQPWFQVFGAGPTFDRPSREPRRYLRPNVALSLVVHCNRRPAINRIGRNAATHADSFFGGSPPG